MAFRSIDDEIDYFGTAVFAGGFPGAMEELMDAERRREQQLRSGYGYGSSSDDDDDDDDDSPFGW